MRAASTGGGLVRFVAIRLVVLAVLVMTAAGASSTSAAASATVTATATVTVAAAAAARKTDAASPPTATWSHAAGTAAKGPSAVGNVTACEPVRVSTRKPACTGQITEGPGPPRPLSPSSSSSSSTSPPHSSRCPAPAPCANSSDNNNNNININNNNYNNNTSNHQCLEYARRELIPTMCPDDRSAYLQTGRLERYRLRHCCHHTVESVVQRPYADRESCVDQVESALHMDDVAAAMSCQFDGVLARYDCKQKYSAKSCESCQDAYARWACAAVLPHWTRMVDDGRPTSADDDDGRDEAARGRRYRVKACRSVCLEAEQTCPWLLPVADTNPYAGEAAFTCMDPDIGYQMPATDTTELCCYEHCVGGLCVRNASACLRGGGGGGGTDQRPVCVEDVKLPDDGPDEKCDDYSLTDMSDGARPTAPGAVAMLLLLSALHVSIRPAWTAAAAAAAATAVT